MKKVFFYFILVLILLPALISTATTGEPAPKADRERLSLAVGICVSKAESLFQSGQVQQAVDLLKTFTLKKDRQHYYLYFLMGNYYLALANQEDQSKNSRILTQQAAGCFQESVRLNPCFPEGWLNLAKCWYETGNFARAASAFEQGYTTSPIPKAEYLYFASVSHFQAKAPQKALDVFTRMMTAHPEEISLSYEETLVHILFSLESHQKALPYIEELARETPAPKKKQWQEILLQQYLFLDMDQKALAYTDFLTQTDTLEPKWWKALCYIHLNGNRIKQGLSALIIYGYLAPMTKEEQMLAADLYLSLEIPEKAVLFYNDAMKETPTRESILKISQACAMAYDREKALAWIEKGLLLSEDTNLLRLKAQVLYGKRDYAAAQVSDLIKIIQTRQKEKAKKHADTKI